MNCTVKDNIYWVGFVDWNVRDFHGYETHRGSTYNAYLVLDEKPALIDAVKGPYAPELLARVAERVDLGKVAYVVCNHAEPDHAGGLPAVMAACPQAELVCNAKCREALSQHFDTSAWRFKVVADGATLSLGRRTLQFFETRMVHWPESMATYVPEEKLLFSMDAFGQHMASSGRFDDEVPFGELMSEAKTYYANILMPFGAPIGRTLDRLSGLELEMVAPSHGVIWRRHFKEISEAYRRWTRLEAQPKVLVVYDTMWKSTEQMAHAILEGATQPGVEAKLIYIRASNTTEIATEVLDAACVAFGSATLNNCIMPQAAAALTYLKGLKPVGKAGFFFGSYGWAKAAAAQEAQQYFEAMKLQVTRAPLVSQFVPKPEILEECRAAGRQLVEKALELSGKALAQ
ncbi:MAG: FprA family A-type flavoprotein [Myxococcales bacterium]|jgi:flavorubredoxin